MTLPASPPITAQNINVELGRAASAAFSINGAEERALAGVPSGQITFNDFLGKSNAVSFTYLGTATGANSAGSFSINFNIGAAHANKTVLVVGQGGWPTAVTETGFVSKTINGTAATQHAFISKDDGSSEGIVVWIISAEVSAAGTVAIAGTYAPTSVAGHTRVDVYTTIQDFTVVETLTSFSNTAVDPMVTSVAIDVSEGGTIISGVSSSVNSVNMAWTNIAEVYDALFSADGSVSGGQSAGLGVQSNRSVSVSQAISGISGAVLAVISVVKA